MSAAILNFARNGKKSDWTDQELAEFYRVANALTQAGREVGTDRGLTDEGDPWFIFLQPSTEDVIAHFARIDGEIVADASALAAPIRGRSLRDVLDKVSEEYTLVLPKARRGKGFFLHPAALLAALVATALLEVEQASASRGGDADADRSAKSDGGRGPNAAGHQGSPVANPSGRAVTFNDSGVVGESNFNASLLMSTIAAVLSLSAHGPVMAAADDGTVAVVTTMGVEQSDSGLAADQADPDTVVLGDISLHRQTFSPQALQAARWQEAAFTTGRDGADTGVTSSDDAQRGDLLALSARLPDPVLTNVGQSGAQTLSGEIAPVAVMPAHFQASNSTKPAKATETTAKGDESADNKSNDGTAKPEDKAGGGAADEMAEAVERLLEGGDLSTVTFPDLPEQTSDVDAGDPGEAPAAPSEQEEAPAAPGEQESETPEAKAAQTLEKALAEQEPDHPTPSDLIFDGPTSGHASLQALGTFFETAAFEAETLSLGFDASDAGSGGLTGDSPLLVAYKSDAPLMDAFTFMPGVVFVDESLVAPYAEMPGEPEFEISMSDANTVEILGFYSLGEAFA